MIASWTGGIRMKPSITTVLVTGFGLLIVVGMALVQGISLWTAQRNTLALLEDGARLAIFSFVRQIRGHLRPVEDANSYIAGMIESGRLDPADDERFAQALLTTTAAARQILGMGFVHTDGRIVRVLRGRGVSEEAHVADLPELATALADARNHPRRPFWSGAVWEDLVGSTLLTVRTPVWEGDRYLGVLLSAVTVGELSRLIAGGDALGGNLFILYGDDHVLAHRNMAGGSYRRDKDIPLPRLDEVGDRVLARFHNPDFRELLIDLGERVSGHAVTIDGDEYGFVHTRLDDLGQVPLTVGIYVGPEDGFGVEWNRLVAAGIAGSVVILVSVAIAVFLGRRVSTPVKALAAAAGSVAALEFGRVAPLKPSRVRELDEAARAFNRMVAGLRWFETYVPRQLVRRLVERDAPVVSEEKQVTVMFTDIAGFSTLSERMPPAEVARLLNAHFTILVGCIEAEGGTVDKYIGDSLMAFWEEDGANAADRALRAAAAIRANVTAENARRRAAGADAVAMRIGIHTGLAIVGNVGAEGRVNYTLIGDTVNVAARLEQLCKEAAVGSEVAVLLSGETAMLSSRHAVLAFRGRYPVRGRDADIEVYELEG